jgi:hypothetical protein
MARVPKRNIRIRRGDTYTHTVTEYDDTGTLSNLTGNTFLIQMRSDSESATVVATFTIALVDPTNGSWEFSLTATQTAAIPLGVYFYDVQRTYSDGTVHTRFEGEVEVEADISRA